MDLAASDSSWRLLPWSFTSRKSKDKLKRLSAFRKRIQAHAVIARTLSPFCTRTLVFEESKCLLAFSALLHSCSCPASTAIKDVQVPTTNLHDSNGEETGRRGKGIEWDMHTRKKESLQSDKFLRRTISKSRSREFQPTRVSREEKLNFARSDKQIHDKATASGPAEWMNEAVPVVKYSFDPYMDFHESMLEMLLGRRLRDVHELQEMFVCFVLLNSPRHHHYIENAFRNLLTDLYESKLVVPTSSNLSTPA